MSLRRASLPVAIYVVAAVVYALLLGRRGVEPTADDHYVHLAESWLHGQLSVVGGQPPGTNDWACYDTVLQGPCPPNVYRFPPSERARYRWYVSFPPFPAVVILPAVAIFGPQFPSRLFWALLGGLAPALLFVLLRFLSETGRSDRSLRDNLLLTALFAFGSVFFFVAVQGTVWFAAHVVACALLPLYLMWSVDARRPWLAGIALGLLFMTRPTTVLLAVFFGVEALRVARPESAPAPDPSAPWPRRLGTWLAGVRWSRAAALVAELAVPVVVVGVVAMVLNQARFGNPFEFGHTYLQIRWRPRIERWGLFNYHYLGRNLGVFLASLPWLTAGSPHVRISRHGLALWVTTPSLLLLLWPKRVNATVIGLYLAACAVMLVDLLYQNTGWVQFGYRFALDYMTPLFVLLALGNRRFGSGFWAMAVLAVVINTFGAVTFDRYPQFYDTDPTQQVIFQPD